MTKYFAVTATFKFPLLASPTGAEVTEETLTEYPLVPRQYLEAILLDEPEERDFDLEIEDAYVCEE